MKLWKIASGLALIALWVGSAPARAQQKHGHGEQHGKHQDQGEAEEKGPQLPLCPVMDDPVDFNIKTMTDEGPVYFCCARCIKKYEKDPQKYTEKVATQRAQLQKRSRVQVNCPLSGEPIDRKVFTEQDGKKVYFCCDDCKGKYENEPARYAAKLEASYTYQTRCPVLGREINPTAFTDLPTGERIYFCCPGCDTKLLADPEKYAPKLEEQGINIDVKKLKSAAGKEEAGEHGHHDDDRGEHEHP